MTLQCFTLRIASWQSIAKKTIMDCFIQSLLEVNVVLSNNGWPSIISKSCVFPSFIDYLKSWVSSWTAICHNWLCLQHNPWFGNLKWNAISETGNALWKTHINNNWITRFINWWCIQYIRYIAKVASWQNNEKQHTFAMLAKIQKKIKAQNMSWTMSNLWA